MPLYTYRCPDGHTVEALRPIVRDGDADVTEPCPDCGAQAVRVIGVPSFKPFPGSYKRDSKVGVIRGPRR